MSIVIWVNKVVFNPKVKVARCPVCDTIFVLKKYNHKYCCRKCFKSDYSKRQKESDFPIHKCSNCGKSTKLDFYPMSSKKRWEQYECPNCGEKQNEEQD